MTNETHAATQPLIRFETNLSVTAGTANLDDFTGPRVGYLEVSFSHAYILSLLYDCMPLGEWDWPDLTHQECAARREIPYAMAAARKVQRCWSDGLWALSLLWRKENGAPRPMKMGTIASPWRYDLLAGMPIRYPNIRYHSPVRYARSGSR
ncbi:hypothetical protein IVB18_46070 [Bradyrhizobium sp. 186]|uniref:hypothetical protein n=1 Tax=Bradyrhizobium sp. 186 TaxID=2782654 RepID=UPI002000907F|nr:hypothetical protein [Bradyrhizobium sp. 186]UPK35256.1 hypothetical protein IVB18_46070 [Bradyrhizobium sp. 186]